ncbi:hypothetical protein D3875_09055 [Deinococcus cavernae]|uniref:Uncharacterized protein n=1 Tax=Deinococcus cavernae TaxID=2320857 RepID=A0A418V6J4_9DEIO|nr:hypothetical protein [Deinococcus cavernae]RJF71696.1 hypothetical protein D3875_09055 [Deinococcus cavernae]
MKTDGSFHYDDSPPPAFLLIGSNKPTLAVYLTTPAGEFDEASVGQLISDMARYGTVETRLLGKMLHKLRHTPETCPASLLRKSGAWHQNREQATRYALAVLTLAVQLRVQEAEHPLKHMHQELARLVG